MINQNQGYNIGRAITKSDTVNFDGSVSVSGGNTAGIAVHPCDAIYVGTAGTIAVVWQDGTVSETTAPSGALLPFAAIRVNSTNTAAAGLVALYSR